MKRVISGAVALMAIQGLCLAPIFAEEKKEDKAAEAVKALDAKLTEAFQARDFELLGKHMADDYLLIDPRGGIHTKAQYLKYLADGKSKLKDFKETDVKARVFGDTAVVTGLLQVKGKVADKDVNAEYRWTRIYNKKGDDWRCVLEQHTGVAPKEAPPEKK